MKSHDPKDWEKLVPGKSSEVKPEKDKLESKILHEKRGEKRKYFTLKDLMSKGNFYFIKIIMVNK